MEHLVESHLGGYYISDGDPEFIEMYCETCGDYDKIVTSWYPEEENGRINALLNYFMMNVMNSREDIDLKVDEYTDCSIETKEIIPFILNDIEYNRDQVDTIVSDLFESHDINEEEYRKIMHISEFEEDRQIKMINHFKKDMFTKDESGKVKVLKLGKK